MNLAAELTAAVVPGQPISSTVKYPLLINMLRNYDNSLKNIAASGRPHSSSLGVFLENMPVRGAVPSEKSHHVVSLAGIRDQLDMQTYSELNERLRADGLEIFDSDIFDRVVDDGKDGSGASGSTSGAGGGVVRERTKAGGSSLIASSAAGATGIVLGLHIVGSEAPDAVKADRVSVIHPPKGTTNAAEKASVDTRQAALDKTHPAADVSHTEAVKELSAAGGEAGQEAGVAEQPSQDKDAPMKAAKAKEAGGGVQQGQAAGPEGEQRSDGDAKKDAGRPVHPDLGSADSTASLPVGEGDGQRRLSDAGQTTEDQGHGRPAAGTGAGAPPADFAALAAEARAVRVELESLAGRVGQLAEAIEEAGSRQ
ncbi:uncharacterized protein LOC129596003 [Paramacrobiotus metropolitanus]|uniref:uncharacterized protein LOC129596003 n=1 Tax=Paramacrobiotus metropolitanus TaxID=2943436 RepID=UPI00244616FD|nr:uncharacterized protein LOC129596003 [Paramacrobiotus metropolitanus]XP_055349129.1 uncharacterized protein LOC129596003 [Paramacrobiotus metropolitanus]